MAKTTIEWTDYSWNPWYGCHKVSQGCKNCYMFREQKQYGRDPNIVIRSKTTFNAPIKWNMPARVFTCSWSDFFIEEADGWRGEVWDIIRKTPHLTYQILTKRPENIKDRLPNDWGNGWSNVWLGVSAEDQENADKRIPILLRTPAAVRFVSYEPALGPVNLEQDWCGYLTGWETQVEVDKHGDPEPYQSQTEKLDWVIMGCESGPGARPMNIEWARSMRDQCQTADVPFFLKQMMIDGKLLKLPAMDGIVYAEYPK